jgi:hypothetical protein
MTMRPSDVDAFAATQAVLAGAARPSDVDNAAFKMLHFMLERPNGCDAILSPERFVVRYGWNPSPHRYILSIAPSTVAQLLIWAGLRNVERRAFAILEGRHVDPRPTWPVAWSFGPRRLWVSVTPEAVELYVRAHEGVLPPCGPEGPLLPEPIRYKLEWLELEAPRNCPNCGGASTRFRLVDAMLICQACGRSFQRDKI